MIFLTDFKGFKTESLMELQHHRSSLLQAFARKMSLSARRRANRKKIPPLLQITFWALRSPFLTVWLALSL
jgi:hypothetical protein